MFFTSSRFQKIFFKIFLVEITYQFVISHIRIIEEVVLLIHQTQKHLNSLTDFIVFLRENIPEGVFYLKLLSSPHVQLWLTWIKSELIY